MLSNRLNSNSTFQNKQNASFFFFFFFFSFQFWNLPHPSQSETKIVTLNCSTDQRVYDAHVKLWQRPSRVVYVRVGGEVSSLLDKRSSGLCAPGCPCREVLPTEARRVESTMGSKYIHLRIIIVIPE